MRASKMMWHGWIAGAALVACDAGGGAEVEARDGYTCPRWQCGLNSAEVNGRSIRELNLDGAANASGVKIVGFVAPLGILGNYHLEVEDDELVAKNANNTAELRGLGLIGATILVKEPGLLSLPLPITVAGYQEIDGWTDDAAPVATYAFVYPDLGSLTGSRNVCNDELLDVLTTSAVVLGGETYDLADKTVNAGMNRWFTIGCAGSATAKLRLLGYGPQSDFDGAGNPASVAQRQATLKMITADYCGDGVSYTANGTPLQWDNASGSVDLTGTPGALEAVWTSNGAVCLETTRLDEADVDCNLPSCSGVSPSVGEWRTYVP